MAFGHIVIRPCKCWNAPNRKKKTKKTILYYLLDPFQKTKRDFVFVKWKKKKSFFPFLARFLLWGKRIRKKNKFPFALVSRACSIAVSVARCEAFPLLAVPFQKGLGCTIATPRSLTFPALFLGSKRQELQ